jgi:hypothetical protein
MGGSFVKRFRLRSREERIEFCDRCGRVCDANCRANAVRERMLARASDGRFGHR